jgi:hypothetical protein
MFTDEENASMGIDFQQRKLVRRNLAKRLNMKTIIHVNQHVVRANTKNGTEDPVLTVKTYKENKYAKRVLINGPSRVVYSPEKPLSCGARVWIETESEVIADE